MKIHPGFNPADFLRDLRREVWRCRGLARAAVRRGDYAEAMEIESLTDALNWCADELENRMKTGAGR
jgi:hypothetical protein